MLTHRGHFIVFKPDLRWLIVAAHLEQSMCLVRFGFAVYSDPASNKQELATLTPCFLYHLKKVPLILTRD